VGFSAPSYVMGNLMKDDEFISTSLGQSNQPNQFPVSMSVCGMVSATSLNDYL
jgi:hypothetical protein